MTQAVSESIPLVPVVNSVIGFGGAEISYLLGEVDEVAKGRMRALLQLEEAWETPAIRSVAVSSLLARGFLAIEGERVVAKGAALVLSFALSQAERMLEIGFMHDDAVDAALHIRAGEVALLLQPRTMNTWFLTVQNPDVSDDEAILVAAEAHVSRNSDGSLYVGAQAAEGRRTMFLRREGDLWRAAVGEPSQRAVPVEEELSREETKTLVRSAFLMESA